MKETNVGSDLEIWSCVGGEGALLNRSWSPILMDRQAMSKK